MYGVVTVNLILPEIAFPWRDASVRCMRMLSFCHRVGCETAGELCAYIVLRE